MHSITCTSEDGVERTFVFEEPDDEVTSDGDRQLFYRIKTHLDAVFSFELQLQEKPDGDFKVIAIGHYYRQEYAAKGIPDSLLPYLARHLGRHLCSSQAYVDGTNEFRSHAATKMWDRLVRKGLAKFFLSEGIYRTTEPGTPPNAGTATYSANS